jgi:hypothetical protein
MAAQSALARPPPCSFHAFPDMWTVEVEREHTDLHLRTLFLSHLFLRLHQTFRPLYPHLLCRTEHGVQSCISGRQVPMLG